MFGAVNALFSGLAFAGLIITIWLQNKQLEQQRDQLAETKEEMNKQKEAMDKQGVENKFFQLLGVHHEIVNSIEITENGGERGRVALVTIHAYLRNKLKESENELKEDDALGFQEQVRKGFGEVNKRYWYSLKHYLRNLYSILNFIDGSSLDADKKHFYISLIEAQLSAPEILLLFYNGIDQDSGIKELLERYHLLKNLDEDKLTNKAYREFYGPSAFEGKNVV
jgi:Putative phage abortive infection protein